MSRIITSSATVALTLIMLDMAAALAHTFFNLFNTLILIWFTGTIENLVCAIIKEKPTAKEKDSRFRYLDYGLISIPELSLSESSKEIVHFGQVMKNALEYLTDLIGG